jgi:hypothetical protein
MLKKVLLDDKKYIAYGKIAQRKKRKVDQKLRRNKIKDRHVFIKLERVLTTVFSHT